MRLKGKITDIHQEKGFAFLEAEDKRDYFLHYSFLRRNSIAFKHLTKGSEIEFTPEENEDTKKVPKAVDASVLFLAGSEFGPASVN